MHERLHLAAPSMLPQRRLRLAELKRKRDKTSADAAGVRLKFVPGGNTGLGTQDVLVAEQMNQLCMKYGEPTNSAARRRFALKHVMLDGDDGYIPIVEGLRRAYQVRVKTGLHQLIASLALHMAMGEQQYRRVYRPMFEDLAGVLKWHEGIES